ncbi:hypothetical protein [Pseudomonas putida]|uniref:Uncharacterized protein n=1 Tax=Pseudomonas putida TaxID=303 RepID=A0A6I7ED26_PSEPU|nr:hypothetical protein [Pseudomonas putida]QHW08383.1 hypothetical protein C2H86_28465 [Pseudomonas putida]
MHDYFSCGDLCLCKSQHTADGALGRLLSAGPAKSRAGEAFCRRTQGPSTGSGAKRSQNYKSPCDRMSQVMGYSPSNMGYWQIRGKIEIFCDDFADWLANVVKPSESRVFSGLDGVFRFT